MAILRKSFALLVLLPLFSCSGQGPELTLRSDSGLAANEVVSSIDTASESADGSIQDAETANNAETEDNTGSTDNPVTVVTVNNSEVGITSDPQQSAQISNVTDAIAEQSEIVDSTVSQWVVIPRIDPRNAPKIDASAVDYIDGTTRLAGEWQAAVQSDGTGKLLGINNFMFGDVEQLLDNSTHHWAAMHDGVYFYLLVISDDAGQHQQDNNEIRKPWKDDTVELYFDGNHSRLSNYDGVDDFQFLINLQSNAFESNNTWLPKPNSEDSTRGRKDIYEFRI